MSLTLRTISREQHLAYIQSLPSASHMQVPAWADVKADLATLLKGRHPGRSHRDEITLFKSVGAAIEDLAAARLVLAANGARQ